MTLPVTVVLPTYNGARFLVPTLRSIAEQTVRPQEVIVVDDASTDGTPRLAEETCRVLGLPARVVIRTRNSGGPAVPMNEGVALAGTEAIVLEDQDDLMTPRRIELQAGALAERADSAMVFGWIGKVTADDVCSSVPYKVAPERVLAVKGESGQRVRWLDAQAFYADTLVNGNVIGASNVAFRKAAWTAVGGFRTDLRVIWDYDFACRATAVGRVGFVNEMVAWFRVHERNFHTTGLTCAREWEAFLRDHFRRPLWPIDRRALRPVLAEHAFTLAYQESVRGNGWRAGIGFASACRYGADRLRCLAGLGKVPIHLVRRLWKSPRTQGV
jgi:glycosyltransferase involved in cell wall biosynthesis